MGKRGAIAPDRQLRQLIAQSAARVMTEEGVQDFAIAKRKAAAQHGVEGDKNLPSNEEVEIALYEYQRLFRGHSQPQTLRHLRETALQAMSLLSEFKPCLVGPVLSGTADEHTPVYLHLFADTAEEVLIFLMEQQIPFEQGERRIQYPNGKAESLAKFSFIAGDTELQLTVFPPKGRRQAPLSPIDGRPQQRADQRQLKALMAAEDQAPG